DLISEKLISIPSNFTAELWLTEMPNLEVPTKVITERRERRGEDDLSFEEAMEKYYFNKIVDGKTIFGRFNGLINDRIGIFPLPSSKKVCSENPCYDYEKVILISEKEAVPNLIIDWGEVDILEDYGTLSYISNLSYYDKNFGKRDGIYIEKNTEGTCYDAYTCILENDRWVYKRPLSIDFMTYDEVLNRLNINGQKPIIIEGNFYDELSNYYSHFSFLIANNKMLGLSSFTEDDKKFYVFINENFVDEKKCGNRSSVDIEEFKEIYVKKNYFGEGNDGIFIEREIGNNKIRDIYKVYAEPGVAWTFPDCIICDEMGLTKVEEGYYNPVTSKWDIKRVEIEY
ncbi:MAG: hypothetical protein K2N51_14595, partial [Lachnospiraceae bacterium]|nr:hypothetical protein [Lachnospiraceae bacterium]